MTTPYPVRPNGETEQGFMHRMAGRQAHQMEIADWMRFMSYEYLAGGERRQRLIDSGLGTEDSRRNYHASAVKANT